MSEQVGVHALVKGMKNHLPKILEQSPEIPALIYQALQSHNQRSQTDALLAHKIERLEHQVKRQKWLTALLSATTLLAASAAAYLIY
jgi:glutamate formiminotransferase